MQWLVTSHLAFWILGHCQMQLTHTHTLNGMDCLLIRSDSLPLHNTTLQSLGLTFPTSRLLLLTATEKRRKKTGGAGLTLCVETKICLVEDNPCVQFLQLLGQGTSSEGLVNLDDLHLVCNRYFPQNFRLFYTLLF